MTNEVYYSIFIKSRKEDDKDWHPWYQHFTKQEDAEKEFDSGKSLWIDNVAQFQLIKFTPEIIKEG
jgi:hypothetical protein